MLDRNVRGIDIALCLLALLLSLSGCGSLKDDSLLIANAVITEIDTEKQTITVKDGYTPILSIGEDGNWYIDGESTGLQAVPEDGVTPTIEVGENGNYWKNN